MSTPPLVSALEGLEPSNQAVRAPTEPKRTTGTCNSADDKSLPSSPHDVTAAESSIAIYVELLVNIRTVTLFASLCTPHTRETTAKLSADGASLTIAHEGKTATVRLPTKMYGKGDANITIPAHPPAKELTLRLQIEEKDGGGLLEQQRSENDQSPNPVPWSAMQLNRAQDLNISCNQCNHALVETRTVREWRDLPNENWAEMMDFWHCHKPHEHGHGHGHQDHDHKAQSSKGYAAGNKLRSQQGLGFVDLVSLLVHETNCSGAKKTQSEKTTDTLQLVCSHCNAVVGYEDKTSEGYRIWKWAALMFSGPSLPSPRLQFGVQKWVAARLLSLIEHQGVRKFHVYADDQGTKRIPPILLWVFTPDLVFSSSVPSTGERPRHDPTRAMKVFWQYLSLESGRSDGSQNLSVEDLHFPAHVVEELKGCLEESQSLLPVQARKFQGWQVGLLARFDIKDTALQHEP